MIFHVQTEDSGLLNPHLFTHLFHEGVIVSTRKLVYDAGANEEAVKSLMQAQHKAVMKDLKNGTFDDKIDQYLSGTPGLEPRAGAAAASPPPRGERAPTEVSPPPPEALSPIEIVNDGLSEPIELPRKARVSTGDRTVPVAAITDMPPPPPLEDNAPTLHGSAAAELAAAHRAQAATPAEQPVKSRTSTEPKVSRSTAARIGTAPTIDIGNDSNARLRLPRDTALQPPDELTDGVPRASGDSIPPATTPVRAERPPSHGAATLPATKPPQRPGLAARPGTRPEGDGDMPAERPGQYVVSRKVGDAPIREETGPIPTIQPSRDRATVARQTPPAGTRIPQSGSAGAATRTPTPRAGTPPPASRGAPPSPPPRAATPPPAAPAAARTSTPPFSPSRAGTPQSVRASVTAPITNRTPSPGTPPASSGVVMSRPAVIVGAPNKPNQPTTQRVRKAREDEGRGFGQGLISEKSLDEVILAYLSEDAEDK